MDGTHPLLSELFESSADEFMRRYWPHTAFHYRAPLERLALLRDETDLRDVSSLLSWGEVTGASIFQADLPCTRDEIHCVEDLSAAKARAAMRSGMSLRIALGGRFDAIDGLVRGLKKELGLPRYAHCRNLTYCSPAGEGASVHFDANANIVIQMAGKKRWRVAANEHVEHPNDRYSAKFGVVGSRLEDYTSSLPREWPSSASENAMEIVMEPGDVLFVPQGWWHSTTAIEESLQLNFTADQPSWARLVTDGLRRRLEQQGHWRELADGVGRSDGAQHERALARLEALLGELASSLVSVKASELIGDADWWNDQASDSPSFAHSAGVVMRVVDGKLHAEIDGSELELELDEVLRNAAEFVCEARSVSLRMLETQFPDVSKMALHRFLLVLRDKGVLVSRRTS